MKCWQFGWAMIVGQRIREQADDLVSVPPCPFDDLVSGSVEVEPP